MNQNMIPSDLQSPALRVLVERGFVHQTTNLAQLDALWSAGPIGAYIGFDLTAPSLHVGSMIQLMALRHIREAELASGMGPGAAASTIHVVFGDATTRIGDPSDKNGTRPILSSEQIEANLAGITACIDRILGVRTDHFNSEWLDRLSFMDFLTGPAREISLNRMVATDVVSRRLEANLPMTLMELIYQTMQAMDFAELARHKGVRLQIGGSDQWTNILAGIDLARRTDDAELFGLTTPLMTDEQGRKMGKTADGKAVWLDPALVSSFDLWQFWRNVPDAKVGEFLGLFTELPMDEVRRLSALDGTALNDAKVILATEAVAIAHGRDAAEQAARAAAAVFTGPGQADGMPSFECPHDPRATIVTVADLMVHTGLAPSKAAARRLAEQGGLRFNGVLIESADVQVEGRDFADGALILAAGKKRRVRIILDREPPLLPRSAWIHDRPDGLFDVSGGWGDDDDDIAVIDTIAAGLPDREAAERRLRLVRLDGKVPA